MGVGRKARRSGRTGYGTGKTVWGLLVFQTARMALLVALVSILAFVLLSVSPVDPLQTNVGQAAVTAGLGNDVPLLLGITVVTAVLAASGNLAASVLYGIVDPRIRKGAAR